MSVETLFAAPGDSTLPLYLVTEPGLDVWLESQDATARRWLEATRFRGERHQLALLPDAVGGVRAAAWGLGSLEDLAELEPWHVSGLPDRLPAAAWRIANELPARAATAAAYGWAYGHYRFDRYRSSPRAAQNSTLVLPAAADHRYAHSRAFTSRSMAVCSGTGTPCFAASRTSAPVMKSISVGRPARTSSSIDGTCA